MVSNLFEPTCIDINLILKPSSVCAKQKLDPRLLLYIEFVRSLESCLLFANKTTILKIFSQLSDFKRYCYSAVSLLTIKRGVGAKTVLIGHDFPLNLTLIFDQFTLGFKILFCWKCVFSNF